MIVDTLLCNIARMKYKVEECVLKRDFIKEARLF